MPTPNIATLCATFAPPCGSTELAGGILKSFTKYLVVEPPSETKILTVTAVVRILANTRPTTASSLFDVKMVVLNLLSVHHLIQNLEPSISSDTSAMAIATAKPLLAKKLAFELI